MATKSATIKVNWERYDLQASIEVTAKERQEITVFEINEGLTNGVYSADTINGRYYDFIVSADTSIFYPITLEDDFGTTPEEFAQAFLNGEISFACGDSETYQIVDILDFSVENNRVGFKLKDATRTAGVGFYYIILYVEKDSPWGYPDEPDQTQYYADRDFCLPPFGSSFSLYNVSRSRSAGKVMTTTGWNYLFKGATHYLKWVTSGTELTMRQIEQLQTLGATTGTTLSLSSDDRTNDRFSYAVSESSSSISSTQSKGWNGGSSYSQSIDLHSWMPYTGITVFGIANVSSTTGDATILASLTTWNSTSQNTYNATQNTLNTTGSDLFFIYDPRIPTEQLFNILAFTYENAYDIGSNNYYQKAVAIHLLCNRSTHYNKNGSNMIYTSPCVNSRPSSITSTMYLYGNCRQYNSSLDAVLICMNQTLSESQESGAYGSYFYSATSQSSISSSDYDYIKVEVIGMGNANSYSGATNVMYSNYIYFPSGSYLANAIKYAVPTSTDY